MPIPFEFDFTNPDYTRAFQWRAERLTWIRNNPNKLPALMAYYRDNPAQFITDWGMTYDPRNAEIGLPVAVPFLLFEKQEEWVNWVVDHWRNRKSGLTDKTRDMGVSWLAIALGCTLCLFHKDLNIGFGSRKVELVDKIGDPDCLLWKARQFMRMLPPEFRGSWTVKNSAHMRINFPDTGSSIKGEGGDEIGRGGRASLYFIDEAAYLERPELVEASLSETTNCRMDVSTPNGMANPFAEKRHSGKVDVFTMHWRDHPGKTEEWYQKKCETLDAVTVAQELDINYNASAKGVLIPGTWIEAAIDAHLKLGIEPTGERRGALDVADEGDDSLAFCGAHGILVEMVEQWSGKGDDIFGSVEHTFDLCDNYHYPGFDYDADGLGAGVRGDSRVLNDKRKESGRNTIDVQAFQGSAKVLSPEQEMVEGRKNKDYFVNLKAQAWWALRMRFEATYKAVEKGEAVDPDSIISLSSKMDNLNQVRNELSQPTYDLRLGKILVNKTPKGTKSPNLADSVMIRFAPKTIEMPSVRVI